MRKSKLLNFTFVVNFRGGTYCTQVTAPNIERSIHEWIKRIKKEKDQIQYIGDKIIEELENKAKDELTEPTPLNGLKNIWFAIFPTKKGSFHLNIIQTDTQ